jgi:phosphonate transport system substrate-binding protein
MVIAQYLRDRQELPERFFGRYIYTYNHDKSLWAVATKVVDGACLDSMITAYAGTRTPDLAANVRVIHSIGPAPTGPLVISKRLGAEQIQQIRGIFLNMHRDPVVQIALRNLLIDRFVPPQPELYEPLRRMYDRTGNLP